MLKYWSNFARYQNPNGQEKPTTPNPTKTLKQQIEPWPLHKVSKNDAEADKLRAFLNLNAEKVVTDFHLRAEYCAFWNELIPSLIQEQKK